VTPETEISDVARQMRDLDVGIIPVVESTDNPRLQGVITDRDIAIRAVAEGKDGSVKVGDCMTRDVRTVNKNDSVRDVMRVMKDEQVRRVPVVDREGRLVGIIAQADLAVDYAGDDSDREIEVSDTLERISEPASPERGAGRMAAGGHDRNQFGEGFEVP
ncbi:MAG: CBS domain-containing protein, partial [Gemmatimonadota bacterium]